MNRFTRLRVLIALAILVPMLLMGGAAWYATAVAGPSSGGVQYRYAAIDGDGYVRNAVLLRQESRTMPNTTPVNGDSICLSGDPDQFAAQLTLQGTMGGTNPTLTVVLQHSIDGGRTWHQVHAFTAINATVTPAAQLVSFSDVQSATATTYGNCFRARYTWGGTGTVTSNIGMDLIAK